jgi:hypothetical protein
VLLLLLACTAPSADRSVPRTFPTDSGSPDTAPHDPGPDTAPDTARPDSGPDTARPDSGADTPDTAAPAFSGPCPTYGSAVAEGVVADAALDELSGLAVSRQNPGVLWTHEDSGGEAELYALDATGGTVATVHVNGVVNVDWEDLAIGACEAGWCLYIGDTGDLGAGRTDFTILVVAEPSLDGTPDWTATPEERPFTYPDGAEDAEGLALTPDGDPLVVTKRADATAGLYRLPPGADVLEHLADVSTGLATEDLTARATAADLWPDPPRLLLRTYLHLYELDVTDLTAPTARTDVPFALELQGEAVAYDPLQGGFWQVAEGSHPTLYWTGCAP